MIFINFKFFFFKCTKLDLTLTTNAAINCTNNYRITQYTEQFYGGEGRRETLKSVTPHTDWITQHLSNQYQQ